MRWIARVLGELLDEVIGRTRSGDHRNEPSSEQRQYLWSHGVRREFRYISVHILVIGHLGCISGNNAFVGATGNSSRSGGHAVFRRRPDLSEDSTNKEGVDGLNGPGPGP